MADLAHLMFWVALGSAVGGLARFAVSGLVAGRIGETFSWGATTVNATGVFAIGFLSVAAQPPAVFDRPEAWPLAVTGFVVADPAIGEAAPDFLQLSLRLLLTPG